MSREDIEKATPAELHPEGGASGETVSAEQEDSGSEDESIPDEEGSEDLPGEES